MIYEWDETKRAMNLAKHGLDFADADLVIENPYVLIEASPRNGEIRQLATAYVFDALVVLSVAFVEREERCHVISYRPASRTQRRKYHAWLEKDFGDDR